jgi:hypothetical protein
MPDRLQLSENSTLYSRWSRLKLAPVTGCTMLTFEYIEVYFSFIETRYGIDVVSVVAAVFD